MGPLAIFAMSAALVSLLVLIILYWRLLRWEESPVGRHLMATNVAIFLLVGAELLHATVALPELFLDTVLFLAYAHLVLVASWRLRLVLTPVPRSDIS